MELYIHIPFCVRKCAYCAFDSFAGCTREDMARYSSAIIREASLRKSFLQEPIETIYIGGGTPSLLPPELLEHIVATLRKIYKISECCEFTIEANPGTVSEKWLDTAIACGVNRISFGVQAIQDRLLQTLGRIHDFGDVAASVEVARKSGFRNINLDLIFGIPGQTAKDWRLTIESILSFSPSHISAYGLIPEEGTPLYRDIRNGVLSLPDPDLERDMYDIALNMFSEAGFQQYEISNFALPGYECRHNIGYWDQIPYIGLGLSAASMIRCPDNNTGYFSVRWTNPTSLTDYYEMLDHPECYEKRREIVTPAEARFETVMLSLRMTSGMRRSRFARLHGNPPEHWYGSVLTRMEKQGLMVMENDSWRLTRRGMDIQNSILLEFME